MDIYLVKQRWKLLLFLAAIAIGTGSLLYTNALVNKLAEKEQKKASIWADATQMLLETSQSETDLNFLFKVIEDNNTVPVILTDQDDKILYYRNLDDAKASKPGYLDDQLQIMKRMHKPLVVELGGINKNYIYYKESILLKQLSIYPYLQLSVIIIFMIVSYVAFSASRNAEQNKVWLGLTRETAHQLGTPISSLIAWTEILRDKIDDQEIIAELEKDVHRLNVITERFSKIGSQPKLTVKNMNEVIDEVVSYMSHRLPKTVKIYFDSEKQPVYLPLNVNLFGWVIENLIKNSLDAITRDGKIEINIVNGIDHVLIDISDNGKGISKGNFKKIFKPGFTTKTRGWGLGLSLTKRIIEDYHRGKIFVLNSELGKGTTFRLRLPKIR